MDGSLVDNITPVNVSIFTWNIPFSNRNPFKLHFYLSGGQFNLINEYLNIFVPKNVGMPVENALHSYVDVQLSPLTQFEWTTHFAKVFTSWNNHFIWYVGLAI